MGAQARGRRDGTGPYKYSFQGMTRGMGKRRARGEQCLYNPLGGGTPTGRGYRTGTLDDIKPMAGKVSVGLRRRVRL